MTTTNTILLLLALLAANLPWFSNRLFYVIPVKHQPKSAAWALLELVVLYFVMGGVAFYTEYATQGQTAPQGWEFYSITACLFLVFAFPGIRLSLFLGRMKHIDLTETCISSEVLVKGKLLLAKRDKVRLPDGKETEREYVEHPGAVLVVPLLADGQLVFERQFRYALHRTFIELPAGKIDPNEDPLQTGKRELLEETGYTAKDWQLLTLLHPCIGYSNEVIHVYLARNLTLGKAQRDQDEHLEIFTMSLPEAMQAMHRGEITDGKTMIALFWAEIFE